MDPALYAIVGCLMIAVLTRIVLDVHHVITNSRQQSHVEKYVATTNAPRVTIVIELTRKAETILPLLDHLYRLQQKNIEVIVLIKQTAGKHAQAKLVYYRRKDHRSSLKLIRHRKGMTLATLLVTQASGQLVVRLLPNDRISTTFIAGVRRAFLDKNLTVLRPHRQHLPDKRLTSGIEAAIDIWQRSVQQLFPAVTDQILEPGVVYRRKTNSQKVAASRLTITTPATGQSLWATMRTNAATRKTHRAHIITTLLLTVLIVTIASAALLLDNKNIALIGIVSFAVLFTQNLPALHGLSPMTRFTMILISPLLLIFEPLITVMSLLRPKMLY